MDAAQFAANRMEPNEANVLGWIHFGDLHLTTIDQQNYMDFKSLIAEANQYLAGKVQFAVLPGDNADDGAASEYALAREAVDELQIPLFAIAGDHDLHTGSLDLFNEFLAPHSHYSFSLGGCRFLFLNAMEGETHKVFAQSKAQLDWVRAQLAAGRADGEEMVIFMHCYPSEVASGGEDLSAMLAEFQVRLVEMGHTHYNELANDGTTIYAATRSTGQIEEGPVGFSITTLDHGVVSWKFHPMGVWPFAMITSPGEAALVRQADRVEASRRMVVRARCWGGAAVESATAKLGEGDERAALMRWDETDLVWTAELDTNRFQGGTYWLQVDFKLAAGCGATDRIAVRLSGENPVSTEFVAGLRTRDQDFVLEARPDKGLLGTQLGPNKNGRKW